MPTWSTACPDWRERIVQGKSLLPCPPLFPDEAAAALDVFRDLTIADVLGKPTFGEISRDWVFDLPSAVFGAYNPVSKRREINEFFELIGKKNAKSTRAAGIMITELVRNERQGAEFLILAPTIEIAKNAADPAMDMVAEHPELRRFLKPVAHQRMIEHRITGAQLKIIAASPETVAGTKATGVLIDELWLFGKMAKAKNMLLEATGGLYSRPEGFVIALSTQSDEPPTGVFLDWLRRYRDIRDGKLYDPYKLGMLYEFPEEMIKAGAYKLPANFHVPNPNYGASVDPQRLLAKFEEATREGQKALVGFFAKHLNVEPGMGGRSDGWPGADFWKRRAIRLTLDRLIERSEVIVVGIDGGGLDDLFGLTIVGREAIEIEVADAAAQDAPDASGTPVAGKKKVKRWLSWSHAWAHRIILDRRKSIATKLEELEEAGELTFVGSAEDVAFTADAEDDDLAGNETLIADLDLDEIIEIIVRIRDAGLLYCVAVDPAGLGELIDALDAVDIKEQNKEDGCNFVAGVSQGYALMNAIKTAERKLANGALLHASQALMDWCVANLKIEPTATAIRATKQNAGDAKIDPAMALFNAVTVMSTNPEAQRSVYEERGLLVF